jgi:hypothetical protein
MTDPCVTTSGDEMNVVGHEHEGIQLCIGPADHRAETAQESPTIIVIVENLLAPIAARHEVVKAAVELEPGRPRHAESFPRGMGTTLNLGPKPDRRKTEHHTVHLQWAGREVRRTNKRMRKLKIGSVAVWKLKRL